jgi:AraC family transcriptional regulator
MHEHLDGTVSIVAIAAVSRMSPSHFIRAFTTAFGMPPHQYLINLRLQKAERLLIESRIPVAEIALQTGFSSQSHLTSAMMRYRQMTLEAFTTEEQRVEPTSCFSMNPQVLDP